MARKPQVRYFASRNAFYCQHGGKQHKLATGPDDSPTGPVYLAALDAFRQLLELGNVRTAKDRNTVRAILETYLRHVKDRIAPGTLRKRVDAFGRFCDDYGERAVADLRHSDFEAFIHKMRQPRRMYPGGRGKGRIVAWGDAMTGSFLESATAAFSWAARSKLITASPLDHFDGKPIRHSRSRECIVSPKQHESILAACRRPSTLDLVIALENTGARPGELTAATARDWHDGDGAIVYYADDKGMAGEFRHKSAAKKDRTVYFVGAGLELMRELVAKHPTGRLFRTARGRPFTPAAVLRVFNGLRERVRMPKLTAYSYRHTFATAWLMAGRSIDLLASLLGNTPETLRKHYSHSLEDRAGIRRHLEEFRGGKN